MMVYRLTTTAPPQDPSKKGKEKKSNIDILPLPTNNPRPALLKHPYQLQPYNQMSETDRSLKLHGCVNIKRHGSKEANI